MSLNLTNVTAQKTNTKAFQNQTIKTLVSQVKTKTGVRNCQVNFAVGFASAPTFNDRLIVTEIGSALFAIGGATQKIEEELNLKPGERAIFSTDENGNIATVIKLGNDNNLTLSNEHGVITLKPDGTVNINNSALEVLP